MGSRLSRCVALAGVMLVATAANASADQEFADEREQMIETIEQHAATAGPALEGDALEPKVLDAMQSVPRHAFVPDDVRNQAYQDQPLPIGHGQTISQPFIVALMTDLLSVDSDDVVFELGTGSGYQAAVLAQLVDRVYTIEIIPELGRTAEKRLEEQGYDNVEARIGDGYYGWPEAAPFDGIVVTAAANHIPPPLVDQLKPGGRMVIPVGGAFFQQELMLVEKQADGSVETRQLLPVRFVPLTRSEEET
jgi:protein-L-isoaspartate(D-aspartate) O-methyltransferase